MSGQLPLCTYEVTISLPLNQVYFSIQKKGQIKECNIHAETIHILENLE